MMREPAKSPSASRFTMAYMVAASLCSVLAGRLVAAGAPAGRSQASEAAEDPGCLKCHNPIAVALGKKVQHAAVQMGCLSCHVNHRERSVSTAASAPYLSSTQPELCLTCHDAQDQKLVAAHHRQPFDKSVCTRCHDPHSSEAPKLMPAQQHGPYDARQCEGCHEPAQDGKVRLAAATTNDLCYRCHDETKTRIASSRFKHTLLSDANSCADCHDPHASNRRYFLKKALPALCNDCHSAVTAGKKFLHEPVRVSCALCHDAHASDFPKNVYAAVNTLCLECHGPNAIKIVHGTAPMGLFNGRVALPPKTFEELRWLQVTPDGKGGHPFPNHPVLAPAQGGKAELNCITCHRPHAGEGGRRRFVTENPDASRLCVRCH